MKQIQNIHNNFVHTLLKDRKNAIDWLAISLPENLLNELDLEYLEYDDTSYVHQSLQEYYSDLTFIVRLSGKPARLYFLIEHKSSDNNEKELFFQLLKYMYSTWEQDIKNKEDLKVIIPIIFYHGEKRWKIPRQFTNLFNLNESLQKYLLDFSYILFDTAVIDEKDKLLQENIFLLSSLLALKTSFTKDLEEVQKIFHLLHENGILNKLDTIDNLLIYIIETHHLDEEKLKKLFDKEGDNYMPNVLEKYINKGREEGKREGKKEGKREGKREGIKEGIREEKIQTARKMLDNDLNINLISEITGLSQEEIQSLR